jgi:hypothetical protein
MVRRLGKYYARRIVNVNVNIVLAGLLALIPTVGVVHLTHYMGIGEGEPEHLTVGEKLAISGITFAADIFFDVAIYYGLHWLANHLPKRWAKKEEAVERLSFFRDATLVQFQRMMISPLLYAIWFGLQITLMKAGVGRELATVAGFVVGILVARTLHTLWMLRKERAMAKQLAGARVN